MGEVVLDDPPNDARVNAVISMTQYVAETSDALPRLIRRKRLGLVSQPPSSLVNRSIRSIFSRISANLCICLSEGKRRISLDDAPQPLLANWLSHNIHLAAEYLLKALRERVQLAKIGKAALRLFRAQADEHIYIRTVGCIAASDRSKDRQSRYSRSL